MPSNYLVITDKWNEHQPYGVYDERDEAEAGAARARMGGETGVRVLLVGRDPAADFDAYKQRQEIDREINNALPPIT